MLAIAVVGSIIHHPVMHKLFTTIISTAMSTDQLGGCAVISIVTSHKEGPQFDSGQLLFSL